MAKKRIGRPVVEAAPGQRAGLSLRVTPELKQQLEETALKKGRSLSQEAEFRLERSFEHEGLLREVLTLACGVAWADFFTHKGKGAVLQHLPEDIASHLRKLISDAISEHYRRVGVKNPYDDEDAKDYVKSLADKKRAEHQVKSA